jgi:hypothetical protein
MRISQRARQYAARASARARSPLEDVLDDELGDGVGDILGGIPLIGGLFGGGKPASPPASATPPVDPATMAAAMASKTSGGGATEVAVHHATEIAKRPTSTDLRNIVKDAIEAHAATTTSTALQAATHARLMDDHAEAITKALSPRAAQTQGGITEQRLQAQATSEHNAIMRREAAARETADRDARVNAKLDALIKTIAIVQRRLAGAELVRGKAIDILGGRDALERHR